MVNGIVRVIRAGEKDLGDGDKGIALLQQSFNNTGQGLRGVERGIVEEHNRAGCTLLTTRLVISPADRSFQSKLSTSH